MFPKLVLTVLLMLSSFAAEHIEGEWSYEEDEPLGPSHWVDAFKLCGDKKQSPIDISSPSFDSNLGEFHFHGYDKMPGRVMVRHDGHTIKVLPDINMSLSGGSLNATYTFHHLHFHWGDNDTLGSEHTIGGRSYPLEMHFVHWNSEKYRSISEASDKTDGLSVLGLMALVVEDNSTLLNKALGNLTGFFGSIHYAGNETLATPFKFMDLFPKNLQYYRYQGSLTTPPCLETVTWTIFKEPIHITHNQAEEFRLFHEAHHPEREMHHAYRPVQPRNDRNLFLSRPFHSALTQSGAVVLGGHVATIALVGVPLLLGLYLNLLL